MNVLILEIGQVDAGPRSIMLATVYILQIEGMQHGVNENIGEFVYCILETFRL